MQTGRNGMVGRLVSRRFVGSAAAIAIAIPLLWPAQAAGSSGWIARPGVLPIQLGRPTVITVTGERNPGGSCQATLRLEQASDSPPQAAIEVAANPTTCQQRIEVGEVLGSDPATVAPDGSASATTNAVAAESTGANPGASPATSQRSGYYYVIWADPADIQLTEVEENMTWSWSGSTVTSATGYDYRRWFSLDGWTEIGHRGPYLSNNGTDAEIWTYDTFYNQPFCGGTWTTYQPIAYFGYAGGTNVGVVNTWAYGCGTSLLWWYSYLF